MNNSNPHTIKEVALWESFKEGNTQAFKVIYDTQVDQLTNYGLRIDPDLDRVKDAIHDMFVDLWNHRFNLSTTDSIQYYLMKAFRRTLIRKVEADRKRVSLDISSLDTSNVLEFSHELTIIKDELTQEGKAELHRALNELSSRQKEILYLRFYNGFTPEEIAQILEINTQSVYNVMHRGLTSLRENMKYTTMNTVMLLLFYLTPRF